MDWWIDGETSAAEMVLAAGFAPALATLSTSCLCYLDYASCWRRATWGLQPVLPRRDLLTKKVCRLLRGGGTELEPPPGIAPGWLAYRARTSLAMLWGRGMVLRAGIAPASSGHQPGALLLS